jgi:hypothetical protein
MSIKLLSQSKHPNTIDIDIENLKYALKGFFFNENDALN